MRLIRPLILVVLISACSPAVGPTVSAPEIPVPAINEARGRLNAQVAIDAVTDLRNQEPIEVSKDYTTPNGESVAVIEKAVADALASRGISVSEDAPRKVRIGIKQWRTRVTATATSSIASEAAITVEVVDQNEKRIFTGSYRGERSSQFPVASVPDIKDSLGLSMSAAITGMLDDDDFINSLS